MFCFCCLPACLFASLRLSVFVSLRPCFFVSLFLCFAVSLLRASAFLCFVDLSLIGSLILFCAGLFLLCLAGSVFFVSLIASLVLCFFVCLFVCLRGWRGATILSGWNASSNLRQEMGTKERNHGTNRSRTKTFERQIGGSHVTCPGFYLVQRHFRTGKHTVKIQAVPRAPRKHGTHTKLQP